jgi:hypothetical protein
MRKIAGIPAQFRGWCSNRLPDLAGLLGFGRLLSRGTTPQVPGVAEALLTYVAVSGVEDRDVATKALTDTESTGERFDVFSTIAADFIADLMLFAAQHGYDTDSIIERAAGYLIYGADADEGRLRELGYELPDVPPGENQG